MSLWTEAVLAVVRRQAAKSPDLFHPSPSGEGPGVGPRYQARRLRRPPTPTLP
jgi:hypothetical protein